MTLPVSLPVSHARDIPDEDFLAAVDKVAEIRWRGRNGWANRWDVAMILGGLEDDYRRWVEFTSVSGYDTAEARALHPFDIDGLPQKVILAKAKRLIARGLLDGCVCGCRGDFERVRAHEKAGAPDHSPLGE